MVFEADILENVPIAIFEEDFSEVKNVIDDLRHQGIGNFRAYFEKNIAAVARCAEMVKIVYINQAAMKLYRARSKEQLLRGLPQIFGEQTYGVFREELITFSEGKTRFESDAVTRTLEGDANQVHLTMSIPQGHEETWSRVLLSVSDITDHKQMEAQLRSSYEYLERLNDSLQEVIFTVRFPERVIEYVNRSIRNVFGYEPEKCIGRTTEFLYPSREEYQAFGYKIRTALKEGKNALHTEHSFERKSGEVFPAEITVTFFKENREITRVISILRDITERKRGEKELRQSEAMLAEAQRIAHLGNWHWNIVENELLWSDEIYRIFGLTPQQFGATYEAFLGSVHPDDREFVAKSVDEALYERRPYSIDHRIVLPGGSVRLVHEEAEVSFNEAGKPIRMAGTVQDITERKLAEERLRFLSRRLVEIQEDERRSIARELHDEIGQGLTALKLSLERHGKAENEDSRSHLKEVNEMVDDLMKKVRELSLELRPRMLDDLGLLPCLLWHFERFQAQTGLNVQFEHAGLNREFTLEISTAAYRIVQEALTNVARHAGVNDVTVRAWTGNDALFIRIEDKGRGFEPHGIASHGSFGLDTMCERAFLLGGTVTIDASPEMGTCILAELPLPI